MNLKLISLNLYSFGYYGGFLKHANRNSQIIDINKLINLAKKFGLGGIEFPFDYYYNIDNFKEGFNILEKIKSEDLNVFIDLEKIDYDYIKCLLPNLHTFDINFVRIKMEQTSNTFYGGNRYNSNTFESDYKNLKVLLKNLCPYLEKHNISLAIENHQDLHSSELLSLSNNISKNHIGINWDIGNSISVLDTPYKFYDKCKKIIKNVHLKDYKICRSKNGIKLLRCPLGSGYVNFKKILNQLFDNYSNINLSIELGAQITRECHINKEIYWKEYDHINFDKCNYLNYVYNHITNEDEDVCTKYESGLRNKEMIEHELKEVEISVNYLKNLYL